MPDELLNLNMGQVQAVIDGYSERVVDATIQAVWAGYYSAYFASKRPKKPTEIIERILREKQKGESSRGNTSSEADMSAELELFAQRDLAFLQMRGGNPDVNDN